MQEEYGFLVRISILIEVNSYDGQLKVLKKGKVTITIDAGGRKRKFVVEVDPGF